MQISKHPETSQDRQRSNDDQQGHGDQGRSPARVGNQRNRSDDRQNHAKKCARQILPTPTAFRNAKQGDQPSDERPKGARGQPECADAIRQGSFHWNLCVIFRLCLEIESQREEQTQHHQKHGKANREPTDAAELQVEKQRREYRSPNRAQQKPLDELTIVAFD